MTVTATQGGNTANGMVLRVLVLTGAADAIAQTGATAVADNKQFASIVTTVTGSRVYGSAVKGPNNAQTPVAGTTVIDEIPDATNGERYYTFKTSAATGTPGSTSVGINISDPGGCALLEVLPDGLITEDSSAPAVVSTTSATTLTTAAFTPPPGSLLVALVASDGGSGQTTMSVTGGGSTWSQVAVANVANDDYAGVWVAQQPPADPFDPVITSTQAGSAANGMLLQLMIITGARPSAQQTGAVASKSASTGANQASITTTVTGSQVYGAIVSGFSPTAAGTTTFINNFNDTTNANFYVSCKATSATGTPGATTIGSTVSSSGGVALLEILPAATLAEDTTDAPPLVTTMVATTAATVNFNAPPGSLLVALVATNGGGAVNNNTVSGGGITWTQMVAAHASAQDYAGVWIADIPMPSAARKVPRTLKLPWSWPDSPPLRHNFSFVETPTAGATVSTVPVANVRDRMVPPLLLRRYRSTGPVPAQVVAAAPPTIPTGQHPHFRLYAARYRSRTVSLVPPQVTAAPPSFVPQSAAPVLRALLAIRRRAATVPLDQAAAPPSGRIRWKPPRLTRRAGVGVPPTQLAPAALTGRIRLRLPRLWRARSATPVPAQVVVTPATYPPAGVRSRVKFWQAWRSHAATVVPPQVVLTPPAYPPQGVRQRARALRAYRGHQSSGPVPPQLAVTPPALVPGRGRAVSTRAVLARRPRTATTPPAQTPPPLLQRVRLKLGRLLRGRTRQIVPPQIIVVPPARVAQPSRKRQWWAMRRDRLTREGWMVGATVTSCDTTRPSTGTTTRPGAGTTAYTLATTARPSSGTTTRPGGGALTEPPCGGS